VVVRSYAGILISARIARMQQFEIEPFLIVGIIAAIRHLLVITAEGVGHVNLADPKFQAILAELALLTFVIFMLAWTMRLLRGQVAERDNA
jgi:hypothetical protein